MPKINSFSEASEHLNDVLEFVNKSKDLIVSPAKINKNIEANYVIMFLDTLPLSSALWWFIENRTDDSEWVTDIFFYLRERYRKQGTCLNKAD